MIRKPSPLKAVEILRKTFAECNGKLGHAKAHDLLAVLEGYQNWAHAKQHLALSAAPAPASALDYVDKLTVAAWPTMVLWEDDDDDGEPRTLHALGATLDTAIQDRFGRLKDGVEALEWPAGVRLSDEERRASIVLEEVHAVIPRVDRYGFPMYASEREVSCWATDEMGWRHIGTEEQALVKVYCASTGDDSAGRWFAQVRVAPDLYARLLTASQPGRVLHR